jgi:hypothetical protein
MAGKDDVVQPGDVYAPAVLPLMTPTPEQIKAVYIALCAEDERTCEDTKQQKKSA